MKKCILIILIISLVLSSIGCSKNEVENNIISTDKPVNTEQDLPIVDIKIGDVLDGLDLRDYDLRNSVELLFKVDFDTETLFPENDKLPDKFKPNEIIEWAKDPGLNVRRIHNKGITGKGVSIAYVDQPLLIDHEEYVNKNIHYEKVRDKGNEVAFKTSMHGPAVTSILLGENLGVAPDVNLYYIAHPPWLRNQTTHAEAIYRIIEINKTLPEDEKIKIIGFSDGLDSSEKNLEAFQKAYDDAVASGIMMFTVEDGFVSAKIEPYKDRDDYKNYELPDWIDKNWMKYNSSADKYILVPSTFTLAGYRNSKSYGYDYEGGFSWTVPYVVGLSALGLQIDSTLDKQDILDYLIESGYEYNGLKIINPEGFIDLVTSRKDNSSDLQFPDTVLKEVKNSESINNLKKLIEEERQKKEKFLLNIPTVKSNNKDMISYIDDGYIYEDLECASILNDEGIEIQGVGVAYEDNYVNIKIKVILPKGDILRIFLQNDLPSLKVEDDGLKTGNNIVILKFDRDELLSFEAGLGINLGDDNFIYIEKDLLDMIAAKQ
ncbi:hypothetical protein CIW83_19065 [Tissierella sp. P1]|uniref:hypothetical protein n=1 Tax=Tissierella sp. P1 TaxID=1280483 RepID=UPI000BA11FD5|nr:hypothetical protein [Tissierella sp. P1]OZV10629.1 hypothetical protein CIW83_19065 [Tissierella sp. P1]